MAAPVLAIHGGCGVMAREELSDAEWAQAEEALAHALREGWSVLARGGRALDAVEVAVVALEDAPQFNAGYGAALNAESEAELDASIMDGETLAAGAVSAVRRIRNPVCAARAVLDSGTLVMLTGAGADRFAAARGLATVEPAFFITARQRERLERMRARGASEQPVSASEAEKHGTVGAVALDRAGHLAAATSTGGFTNKPLGRVGDSPIIGAGTYARDGACAVSCTGQGEVFIRHVVGHEIASRIAYFGETLEAATTHVLGAMAPYGIGAGLIAVDAGGHVAAPFNTGGMFRGWVRADGSMEVGTHAETRRV